MESQNDIDHGQLLLKRTVAIHLAEGALLKEGLLDQACRLERDALLVRQGIRPDQLHDVLQLLVLLEQRFGALTQIGPRHLDILGIPGRDVVLRVGGVPVNRRKMTCAGQIAIESPKGPHESLGMRHDWLREIAARR